MATRISLTDAEAIVLNALTLFSKRHASGKGGLDAGEIMRASGGMFGSRVLVDTLASLFNRKLIIFADTDQVVPRRLWYLSRPRYHLKAPGMGH